MGTPWAVMGAFLGLAIAGIFSLSYVNNIFSQIGPGDADWIECENANPDH
jgi:hypothetical protein